MNTSFQGINKARALYISELSQGCTKYLLDHMDQNIANESTTIGNVLAEMLAIFLAQVPAEDHDDEFNEVLGSFLELCLNRVKVYKLVIKELENEE